MNPNLGFLAALTVVYIYSIEPAASIQCLKLYDNTCSCHSDCCSEYCFISFEKILTQRRKGVCKLLSHPKPSHYPGYIETGNCSYYDGHGITANGELFNQNGLTAAHRTLPFGTTVRVEYGGRSVNVRINDRGPFIDGRILDLAFGAAKRIGIIDHGVVPCKIEVVDTDGSATLERHVSG